jgi:hypothetical protein
LGGRKEIRFWQTSIGIAGHGSIFAAVYWQEKVTGGIDWYRIKFREKPDRIRFSVFLPESSYPSTPPDLIGGIKKNSDMRLGTELVCP